MPENLDVLDAHYNPAGPPREPHSPMPTKLRLLMFAVPVALFALPTAAFAINEAVARGEIEPAVSAAGIDLSGLGRGDALSKLRAYETELRASQATFIVKDTEFTLSPVTVGLDIDEESIVDQALAVKRGGGYFSRIFDWLTRKTEYPPVEIDVDLSIDSSRLDAVFDAWEQGAIAVPPYEGDIVVTDGRIVPQYPRPGEGIDRVAATRLAADALQDPQRGPVVLPTRTIAPEVTEEDLNHWVEEASRYIDGPVTLTGTNPDVEITFTRDDLVRALRTELKTNSPATFNVWLDASVLVPIIEPYREIIEQPPRDAEVVVDEDAQTVTVVPSQSGVLLDVAQVVTALSEAAVSEEDAGFLPYAVGEEPEITTEDVASWGPLGLVSSFTTKHHCCEDRVGNIHLFADTIDGAVVMPGEEFSLNGYGGERTLEKGYKPAGTLISGELVNTVGGGVSQFATTFYNAVFYGCYEDVSHKPHTYYFTRYPEVNEATISWPSLDLRFRNDSEAPIWIKTHYTGTSITVEFYGNNGGRTCERRLGNRYAWTDPKLEYVADPTLDPGVQDQQRKGFRGWTNTVTRVTTWPDGSVEEQLWTWRYSPESKLIAVHPCMLDGNELKETLDGCPKVPNVVGSAEAAAISTLQGAGYAVTVQYFVTNNASDPNGKVKSQTPAGDTYKAKGANVTIVVWKYEELPPP